MDELERIQKKLIKRNGLAKPEKKVSAFAVEYTQGGNVK